MPESEAPKALGKEGAFKKKCEGARPKVSLHDCDTV
jgi:hypothetical protein